MDPKLLRMYSDILNEQGFPQQYALRNTEDPSIAAARQQATASAPAPGTAAAVRGARGGTSSVTAPQAAKPTTPLPGNPNAPAYQKDPGQTKKVGTGASGFPVAGQGGRPTPAPAIDPRVASARAADAKQQAQTPQGVQSPTPPAGQTSFVPSSVKPPAATTQPTSGGTSTPSAGGMPNTTVFGGKPTSTAADNPFAMKAGGGDKTAAAAPPAQSAPSGVFSTAGDLTGGAGRDVSQQAAKPSTSFGGGYDPTKVQYAVDQPKDDPQAVKGGFGQSTNLRTDTPDQIAKRGPMGTTLPEAELEEDLEEEIEENLEEELEEAFNEMLRLSGIKLNEQSEFSQRMAQRMAATRAAGAGVAPGTTQTSTGAGGATMSVTKSAPVTTGSGAPVQSALGGALQTRGAGQAAPATQAAPAAEPTPAATAPAAPAPTQAAKPAGGFSAVGRGGTDFEESIEEELEKELEEAFNSMLKLSGIQLNEKAPPGAKAERMVKHIKKGYAKDGKLSDKEKSIAYATAWKAHNKGKLEEGLNLMLDEEGHTLEHIVNRFKHEAKTFLNTGEMSDKLYDALYDYYLDRGEMPYGIAKAREGDPYTWVAARFEADIDGTVDVKMPLGEVGSDHTLNELARLAGLSESRVDECGDMGMDTDDRLNVSTNMSSDGTKSVNISAQGEKAEELLSVLKLAGMGGSDRPSMVMIDRDEEMMEREEVPVPDDGNVGGPPGQFVDVDEDLEEAKKRRSRYGNTPDEEYQTVASITRQGGDLNREKKQFANMPKAGDNPMATDYMLDEELSALLDSVLVKEADRTVPRFEPPENIENREKPYKDEKTGKMITPPQGLSISEPVSPAKPVPGIKR